VEYLEGGGRVLLADPAAAFTVEATNYRLSSWDGGGPSGNIVNTVHPALRAMPTDDWCDLQFYHLIQDSKTALLAGPSKDLAPIVRCIDRPTRLANRAYLFEATLRRGKLLVSGFNFSRAVESGDPAGIFLLDQLVRYALGNEFRPTASISADALRMKVEQ
jgi:hypothetical protein